MTRDGQLELAAYEGVALWNSTADALNLAARLALSIVMVVLLTLVGWLELLHKELEPKGRDERTESTTINGRCTR